MKVFQKSFLVLLTIASLNMSALANMTYNEPITNVSQELRQEIIKLVQTIEFEEGETIVADVNFIINNKREIVVLHVATNNKFMDNYIKNQLNYHQLKTTGIKPDSKYNIKISFKSE